MVPHHVFYQLALFVLVWLFVMLHVTWSKPGLTTRPVPAQPKRKRSSEPKPFAGLTHKPPCALCEQAMGESAPAPPLRPEPMPPTNRRPRSVDTSMHFCPHSDCDYRGWLGLNNLRANGHPSGGPWRQFQCLGCHSLRQVLPMPEPTHGTGAAKVWRPCTPAMAAGLTDHVWSLTEVLCYRVPPWPQAQTV